MYVWESFRRDGARIHVVESDPGGIVPTERLLEAIDEETLIVPISHVCFRNSYLQDARAICARAREVGALVLLDAYQSLGTVPVDVQELDVDMVCGGSVKWLLGGPGAGYLYVRPDLHEGLAPADHRLGRARRTLLVRAGGAALRPGGAALPARYAGGGVPGPRGGGLRDRARGGRRRDPRLVDPAHGEAARAGARTRLHTVRSRGSRAAGRDADDRAPRGRERPGLRAGPRRARDPDRPPARGGAARQPALLHASPTSSIASPKCSPGLRETGAWREHLASAGAY